MSITDYIYTLPSSIQDSIKAELYNISLNHTDIEIAMNSRLCDLSDTININQYL